MIFDINEYICKHNKKDLYTLNMFGGILITNLNKADIFIINQCIIEFDFYKTHFTEKAYDLNCNRIYPYFGFYKTDENVFINMTKFWNRFDILKRRK